MRYCFDKPDLLVYDILENGRRIPLLGGLRQVGACVGIHQGMPGGYCEGYHQNITRETRSGWGGGNKPLSRWGPGSALEKNRWDAKDDMYAALRVLLYLSSGSCSDGILPQHRRLGHHTGHTVCRAVLYPQ